MQARFVNKFQPKRKQSKSQQKFWTKSAVFARVCYGCGPLWVAQAFRTLGWGSEVSLFVRICPSMQLEQATHTALKVRRNVGQSFKWQVKNYLINHEVQSFCGWVSSYSFPWFSYCTFHSVHEFKNSKSRQYRTCHKETASTTMRFECPQNWNKKTAWLVGWGCENQAIVHECSMGHGYHPLLWEGQVWFVVPSWKNGP